MDMISRRGFMMGSATGAAAIAAGMSGGSIHADGYGPIPLKAPMSVEEIPTPALVIDLDVFESNLAKMAAHGKAKGIGIRPHGKTHKCPIIAKKQLEAGAIGVCAAKVSEAEVFVDSGIENVLITSPVATKDKIDRVIALAKKASGIQMVVDNEKTARDFNDAAKAAGITLRVLIDLDTGTRRTGIEPGDPALALVKTIATLKNLQFDGCTAYAGHVMHVPGFGARKEQSLKSLLPCFQTKKAMEDAGFEVKAFSGGGTGTYDIDCDLKDMTDLQVGSYPFMDVQYRLVGDPDSELFDTFAPSLFVLSTAISQPVPDRITFDAGFKAFANEVAAKPVFRTVTGVEYNYGGDEHGIVRLMEPSQPVRLGDRLELIVSHCDPTVNLYDVYYPYRNGKVEELWPVSARGKSQ